MTKSKKGVKSSKQSVKKSTKGSVDHSWPVWLMQSKWHGLVIILLGLICYSNTIGHDYTQDDAIVIYENMFTTEGIEGIPGILKHDTFYGFFKQQGKEGLVAGGRYRPLTLVLFAIGWELFGDSPMMGHVFNIIYYILVCLLLYFTLKALLSLALSKESAVLIAFFSTILFLVHPVHTEVVANIKGRDEIITLLGSLGALWFSIKAFKTDKIVWAAVAALCLFLGLMSKENAIVFVAVVPLALFCFTKAQFPWILKLGLHLVVGAMLFLFIRGSVLGTGVAGGSILGGDPPKELMNNPFLKIEDNRYVPLSFNEKSATITYTLGKYVQLMLFPHPLTHDYYPRHIEVMSWSDWQVWLSFLIYLILFGLIAWSWKRDKVISFGLLLFLMSLFIVSNIVFPIGTNMAERFLFMPSVGICLCLGWLMYKIGKSGKGKTVVALSLVGVISLLFAAKAITRNTVWENNYTLFTTDIETSARSAKLQNAVGGEIMFRANSIEDNNEKQQEIRKAMGHLEKAIAIHPTYKNTYLQLGNGYNYLNEYDQAIKYYEQAINLDKDYHDAIKNLGITYRSTKKFDLALQKFEQLTQTGKIDESVILHIAATYEEAGKYYGEQGNNQQALSYFQRGLDISTDKGKFNYFIGVALGKMGKNEEAAQRLEIALEKTPSEENRKYIYNTLIEIYKNLGALDKAAALQQKLK